MEKMKEEIQHFIAQKKLGLNSQKAYFYDLQQFVDHCGGVIGSSQLASYQLFLQTLQVTAQRRKRSAVNQFLYHLYEKGLLERYYKVSIGQASPRSSKISRVQEDLSILWQDTDLQTGQLIALLIWQLGLLPSEIAEMKQAAIDLSFEVVTIEKKQQKRVLTLPKALLPYLAGREGQVYLFDKKGKPYSRQWFFTHLSEYVAQLGRKDWTAQKLREQYILAQLEAGKSLEQLAKNLGLKSTISLEKYR